MTRMRNVSGCGLLVMMAMQPVGGVNLIEFFSTFQNACSNRPASPITRVFVARNTFSIGTDAPALRAICSVRSKR